MAITPKDAAQPAKFLNGGNYDYWNRVYATIEEANATILNELDIHGVNFRSGKVVQIGTVTNFVEHHWLGGFQDYNLVPKVETVLNKSINQFDINSSGNIITADLQTIGGIAGTPSGNYNVTAYSEAIPGQIYSYSSIRRIEYRNASNEYISIYDNPGNSSKQVPAPAGSVFQRSQVLKTNWTALKIVKGSVIPTDESLLFDTIKETLIPNKFTPVSTVKVGETRASTSDAIYNFVESVAGYLTEKRPGIFTSGMTGERIGAELQQASGALFISSSSLYNVTADIPISSSTQYTASNYRRVAFLNSSDAVILPVLEVSNVQGTFTSPAEATKLRAQVLKTNWQNLLIVQGSTVPSLANVGKVKDEWIPNSIARVTELPSIVNSLVESFDFMEVFKVGNLLKNGDFENGLNGHQFLTTDQFLPPYSVDNSTVTPIGNTSLRVVNSRRSSDLKRSILRDEMVLNIPQESRGGKFSFSYLFKGDTTKLTPTQNIQSFTASNIGTLLTNGTALIEPISGSDWVKVNYSNLQLPADATYIKIYARIEAKSNAPLDEEIISYHTGLAAQFSYIKANFSEPVITQINNNAIARISGDFTDEVVTFWGDSITHMWKWQPYAIEALKIGKYYNRGIGGSTVTENNTVAWVKPLNDLTDPGRYVSRPGSPAGGTQPAGTIEIKASMSNQERIDTIPLDTTILFIMAGTNDANASPSPMPLGTINDTDVNTFYGAYKTMLNRIYARVPNARVVIADFIHKRGEEPGVNNTQDLYRKAIQELSYMYRYAFCDMLRCGINELNSTLTQPDGVHPEEYGGQFLAGPAIKALQQIKVNPL